MKDQRKVDKTDRRSASSDSSSQPLGEFEFIKRIRVRADQKSRGLATGIGDDAAVLRPLAGKETVISADLLVENIDFQLNYTTPNLLGHKALAVSLSDIAAMGARPRWAMLSIGVPSSKWRSKFLDGFYEGFFELAANCGVALIGGDVSRTPDHIVIDSIVIGETERGRSVLRSGARAGDLIYVTGSLGGSAAGLKLLQSGRQVAESSLRSASAQSIENLLLRHLRPDARLGWGHFLGKQRLASAMIDISDGLSSDLMHICEESGVGATVEQAALPVDPAMSSYISDPSEQLPLMLNGGEDFELLFTVRPRNVQKLPANIGDVKIARIGRINRREDGVSILREDGLKTPLSPGGFKHFSERTGV